MASRRFWLLVVIFFTFSMPDGVMAQPSRAIDSASKKMAIKFRLKSRLIRIKKPVLYLGFHNSNPDLKPLEEQLEKDFIDKLKEIMMLDSLEVASNMESYDRLPLQSLNIHSAEFSRLLPGKQKYAYIIHGLIEKSQQNGEIIVQSRLYNLPYDNSLVEASAAIQN